jgi:hypothetical protein
MTVAQRFADAREYGADYRPSNDWRDHVRTFEI